MVQLFWRLLCIFLPNSPPLVPLVRQFVHQAVCDSPREMSLFAELVHFKSALTVSPRGAGVFSPLEHRLPPAVASEAEHALVETIENHKELL